MRKSILTLLTVFSLGASSLLALPTVSLTRIAGDSSGGLGGGAFNAATQFEGNFRTFCLESTVTMSLGTTYYYSWSNVVQNQNDPISLGSALLMNNYATGAFGSNYAAWGGATGLQQAFWYLENESNGVANQFVAYATSILGGSLLNNANGAYGVRVMNVWSNSNGTGDRQSQIAYYGVPDAGSTLALSAFALGGMMVLIRRRKA
ncbi:MAG: VPDSG-CTERM sorting domain-containing protein [Opitutaceae bacterium]|nr:VPDSG-CTERM sorting domain-containing protein [Opitutaceae bacterium]